MEILKNNITINGEYFLNSKNSWQVKKNKERKDIVIRKTFTSVQPDTVLLPTTSYNRVMLRSVVFSDKNKGFIFGGSLDQNNQKAVIYHTVNSGKSWELMTSKFPHIHYAFLTNNYIWISGKEGLLKSKKT